MRVHANRDSALVLAAQASKAVPKITTIPELKGIHMEADARLAMLTMTATNQEVSIRASMPAAVEESGSAVIPADLLPDILKRLPGDQVSFSGSPWYHPHRLRLCGVQAQHLRRR